MLDEVKYRTLGNSDIHILLIPPESNIKINALQGSALVIICYFFITSFEP